MELKLILFMSIWKNWQWQNSFVSCAWIRNVKIVRKMLFLHLIYPHYTVQCPFVKGNASYWAPLFRRKNSKQKDWFCWAFAQQWTTANIQAINSATIQFGWGGHREFVCHLLARMRDKRHAAEKRIHTKYSNILRGVFFIMSHINLVDMCASACWNGAFPYRCVFGWWSEFCVAIEEWINFIRTIVWFDLDCRKFQIPNKNRNEAFSICHKIYNPFPP